MKLLLSVSLLLGLIWLSFHFRSFETAFWSLAVVSVYGLVNLQLQVNKLGRILDRTNDIIHEKVLHPEFYRDDD